jgi:hypothetical protein
MTAVAYFFLTAREPAGSQILIGTGEVWRGHAVIFAVDKNVICTVAALYLLFFSFHRGSRLPGLVQDKRISSGNDEITTSVSQ